MECVWASFRLMFVIWREVSSGGPLSNLQAFHDSTSSMMVFKTEDMVETSAPAGTSPDSKVGNFVIDFVL